jgi:hypothetical protein
VYNPPNGTYNIFAGAGPDLPHIEYAAYYPTGVSAAAATPITIQDGVTLTHIDITLVSVR